jgi:hypothetical protein
MDVIELVGQEEEAAKREIEEALDAGDDRGLKLVPLAVLAFIGVKVALPVATGFVSRELWERYNHIKTHAQADKARAALTAAVPEGDPVDEESVVAPVVKSLREEGVEAELAERVARRAYARMQTRVSSAS